MGVKIGHARIDENGRAKNGKAGDQTKKEVMISDWYDGNWHTVFRAKNSKQAEKIAPVNLNPSHSINDNKPIQIIKPNIFFTFLSLS